MAKDDWSPDGTMLPTLEEHTRKKHEVVEQYIHDWVVTLCSNHVGQSSTLTIIDAFCGGGIYEDPKNESNWLGSPIRFMNSVAKALHFVQTQKGKPGFILDVHFIFADSNKNHLDCLRKQIKDNNLEHHLINKTCTLIEGEFLTIFDRLINVVETRKGHSFFFIDPYGYTDYSMANIRRIMSIRNSEVLVNYMLDFIQRFLKKRDQQMQHSLGDLLEAGNYYRDLGKHNHLVRSRQSYLRNETIRLFREKALVKYAYSFGMITDGQAVKYYLIHLANNPTAQKVIKDALWFHNNIYQYQYEIFGLSFKVPLEDEELMGNLFNINEDDDAVVQDRLQPKIMDFVAGYERGISFRELHTLTMQENPASTKHYQEFLAKMRDYTRDIEILRDGKTTKAKNIQANDIIKRSNQKIFNFPKED
ncbi:MAG: three-Cys-motif partner protein TcmP [Leptospirales bacterium]